MIVKPKVRGFICTTSHPKGCEAAVQEQIDYVKSQGPIANGPKKVLVIGSSTGFGLSTRITSTFGCGADTIGVFFEKEPDDRRTASAGWYQSVAFEKLAKEAGFYAKSFNGDAFSTEMKEKVINAIKEDMGEVDLVVYSLASPRRQHPITGKLHKSTLKPIGQTVVQKTIDTANGVISTVEIGPANEQEIEDTITVMGGEDWKMWMEALKEAGVLADGAVSVAYSYIGPVVTQDIYRTGTIGQAKVDLENTADVITDEVLKDINGKAYVSVNKALVTQASSAIPVMPLYINILYKVMKAKGIHEECKEQIYRLFKDILYTENGEHLVDEQGRIRIDDLELRDDVQAEVSELFDKITTENQAEIGDLNAYNDAFLKLFGFGFPGVDYDEDVDIQLRFED
jgi:enoyl-[acyl-carrier protein] reductase/trans-2-enoyl-CoA reductase (NAD+)